MLVNRSSGVSENQRLRLAGDASSRLFSAGVLRSNRACANSRTGVTRSAAVASTPAVSRRWMRENRTQRRLLERGVSRKGSRTIDSG